MQDKKNIQNTDLVNKGWTQMEAILDKEMPIQRTKNRYFIWLFLGLFLISSGFFIYNSITSKKSNPGIATVATVDEIDKSKVENITPNNKDENLIINQLGENINEESDNENHAVGLSEEIQPGNSALLTAKSEAKINPQASTNTSLAKAKRRTIQNKLPTTTKQNAINSTIKKEIDQSTNEANNSPLVNETITNKTPTIETKAGITNEKSSDISSVNEIISSEQHTNDKKLNDLRSLDLKKSFVFHDFNFDEPTLSFKEFTPHESIEVTENRNIHFGFYAGILTTGKSAFNGFQFGFESNLDLSEKLGIAASIGYTKLNKKETEASSVLGAELLEDPVHAGMPTYVLNSEIAYNILKTRSYIDFSLRPKFKFSDKLSLSVGPSLSYLLKVENSISGNELVSLDRSFLKEEQLIRKVDISMILEVKYEISRRFGISVLYNHGMNSLWSNTTLEDREFAGLNDLANLVYENTTKNFNRFLGLRGYIKF